MNKCDLINDLLPLYTEGLLSETSNDLVQKHLKTCPSCAKKAERLAVALPDNATGDLNTEEVESEKATIKRVKKKFGRKSIIITVCTVLICAVIALSGAFVGVRYCTLYPEIGGIRQTRERDADYAKEIMPAMQITSGEGGDIVFTEQDWCVGEEIKFSLPEKYTLSENSSRNNLYMSEEQNIFRFASFFIYYDSQVGWNYYPNQDFYEELKSHGALDSCVDMVRYVMEYDLSAVGIFSSMRDIRIASAVREMKAFVSTVNNGSGRYYPVTGDLDGYITTDEMVDGTYWCMGIEHDYKVYFINMFIPSCNSEQEKTVKEFLSSIVFA